MFHLVEDSVSRIENNLIAARRVRDGWFSMWFNIILLVVVVGSFSYFLYASYGTAPPEEFKAIKYEAVPWLNAVRNVRDTDYGQKPQTDSFDIQGYSSIGHASSF